MRACADLSARGERVPAAEAGALRDALSTCLALAVAERDRLAGALDGAARSRRAAVAYRAQGPGKNCPP